jgi:hypothetical protein
MLGSAMVKNSSAQLLAHKRFILHEHSIHLLSYVAQQTKLLYEDFDRWRVGSGAIMKFKCGHLPVQIAPIASRAFQQETDIPAEPLSMRFRLILEMYCSQICGTV